MGCPLILRTLLPGNGTAPWLPKASGEMFGLTAVPRIKVKTLCTCLREATVMLRRSR